MEARNDNNLLASTYSVVWDLSGNGKVYFEDAKNATARVREVPGAAAAKLGKLAKSAPQSIFVQAAAGAVVGGVLASMIPFR